jgi:hypothetical protein
MCKKNRTLFITIFLGMIILLFSSGLYAGAEVKDEIRMENKAYTEHKKSIQVFTHKKHATDYSEEYPSLYENGCGECHHDENNKPLKDLKEGDQVENCIECHEKPEYMRGKKARGLSKEQKLEYHANAIHYNCKGCHRQFNKKMELKSKDDGAAPIRCKQCHPK